MESFHLHSKPLFLAAASLALAASGSCFANGVTLETGVDTNNNNISSVSTASSTATVDKNWSFVGYFDSYGITRGQVFGSSVSDPSGAIGYNISSAAASAASTGPTDTAAYVITGGNRPGWYNPGNGAQWLADLPNQNNGGIPINPPGNYQYQLNLSPYISTTGGLVTVTISGINADNHYELAIANSVAAKAFLVEPFATQETWNVPGNQVSFSFSPKDGTTLDLIVANSNDQTSNGKYVYEKNPTGFLISKMAVTQASGPTPAQDKMISLATVTGATAPGSGTVYSHQLVAAPEPSTWAILGAFLLLAIMGSRFQKPLRD